MFANFMLDMFYCCMLSSNINDNIQMEVNMALKRSIVILLAVVLLVTPILMNADDSTSSAIIAADRDAKANTSGALWFGAGCLFGLLGVGAAYIIEPSPSAQVLLGKSPEYVAAYTSEYKSVGRSIQTKNALTGCVVGAVVESIVYVVYYFVVVSAVSSAY